MKTLKCSDVGFVCDHVIQADTIEDVMQRAAEHARTVHQVEVTPEQAAQIVLLIHERSENA
jgi:predicted small metal-binding protein